MAGPAPGSVPRGGPCRPCRAPRTGSVQRRLMLEPTADQADNGFCSASSAATRRPWSRRAWPPGNSPTSAEQFLRQLGKRRRPEAALARSCDVVMRRMARRGAGRRRIVRRPLWTARRARVESCAPRFRPFVALWTNSRRRPRSLRGALTRVRRSRIHPRTDITHLEAAGCRGEDRKGCRLGTATIPPPARHREQSQRSD